MPSKIADYALIGDCETAALVSRDGSIDWLCWPRFDSDACFAALLGTEDHGRWWIGPKDADGVKITRRYRPNTLVLETRFETKDGAATLIDFMPRRGENSDIVRIVVGERGSLTFCTQLVLRFDYGRVVPWVTKLEDRTLRAIAGPDMVLLRTPVEVRGENMKTVGEFTVSAGERVPFVLTYSRSHLKPPKAWDPERALRVTEEFWTKWAKKSKASGPDADLVVRSLITLKALTFGPTGGIVAAPTTSLPEQLGGVRNWDYRFCWLRDATLTLLALMNGGHFDEARDWREWLLRAVAGKPEQIQILYGIAGERRASEWEIDWLPGYRGAKPVRVGNAAHDQLQLDVYGEVMDALHQARVGGLSPTDWGWAVSLEFLKYLERAWRQPDESIWEVRGPRRHFTYSKVMCWVAFDRGIKSVEQFKLDGPVDHWREICRTIHAEICERGFDRELNSFVQAYGSKELDASMLLLPTVGFLPPTDPRIRGTVEAIEKGLMKGGFVQRYRTSQTDDGLPPGEGVFLACSFWLVDAYVMLGRLDDARTLFKRLAGLCNDVGLLSEEYDPESGELVGNFPQAFSHVALVNSAFNIDRAEKPAEQRGEQRANEPA